MRGDAVSTGATATATAAEPLRVLIIEDQPADAELMVLHLIDEGFDPTWARVETEAGLILALDAPPDVILSDWRLPRFSGLRALRAIRGRGLEAPFVIVSGSVGEEAAIDAIREGADDYVIKDRLARLGPAVRRTIEAHRLRADRLRADQALRESEALYRTLVEGSADGILVSDTTGRYVEANAAICRMLGYSRDEILAMYTPNLSAADDPMSPADMDERLAETQAGTGLLVERRYRRKVGSSLPAEVNLTQLPDGRLQRTIRDITSRLAAEAKLRESERTLAEAQRIAHIGSWDWDLASGTARRSVETNRIFGILPGGIAGTTEAFLEFVHRDDRDRVRTSERAAIALGTPHNLDYRSVRPDGEVRLVHEEGEVIRDASGTPVRMVGIVQDITERRASEAERTRLVSAVEQTADSILMHDLDGNVTYVNPAFSRVYGYESGEIVGRNAGILASGRHEQAFFSAIWASAAASGRPWTGTIVNRRKDGTPIELESVISAILDADGRLAGYLQTDRDVTRERELERANERDARERETIESALAQIDPAGSAEEIAAAACAVINGLPGVDSTVATALDEVEGAVLAATGQFAPTFAPGRFIPAARVGYLRERGAGGPWFEEWRPRSVDGAWGEAVTSTGLRAMAYAPLRSAHGVVGVVAIGSHDTATAQSLVEHVPALAAFASILGAMLVPKLADRRRDAEVQSVIRAVVDASAFAPFFQPIVDIHTGSVVGYEALSRFTDGVPPDARFAAAARAGLGIELELATLRAAITGAAVLPLEAYLSLNASPELIGSGALRVLLAGIPRPLVLEITQHVVIEDYAGLRRELEALGPTVRLAVDDAGAGYASFRHILELAPDVVKLDIGLIRGIDADPARQALLAGMAYFATKRSIRLVAEGIETQAELETLRSLAIHFGQGYLLGRPQDSRSPGPWPTKSDHATARRGK